MEEKNLEKRSEITMPHEEISKEERVVQERERKIFNSVKRNPAIIFYFLLIVLVILGVYIRMQPLLDHGGRPGLWDSTTNDYTLGPDLDPFLFLRYAKEIIENGSLSRMDTLRNVPLGFDTSRELQMVSYMIFFTYRLLNIFGSYSINYAGAFMPVLFFALTIIAFFLFVREIFLRKHEKESYVKSSIIALIATFFMIVIPAFLSRTVAGIPEKESVAFFFMFLSFYLFLRAWKAESIRLSGLLAVLAGLSTALMGLTWGGVSYVYLTIGVSSLIAFILNKFNMKETIAYGLWFISSLIIFLTFTNRDTLKGVITSIDSGLAFVVLLILVLHLVIWKTKIKTLFKLEQIKLPKTITSIIITVLLVLILGSVLFGFSFFGNKVSNLYNNLIKPTTGRWNTTVAENRQPYFSEWAGGFGVAIFWLFVTGSVVLFREMLDKLKKKEAWVLTGLYILFFLGLVFSRYAPHPSLFDGENFISKLIYFGSALLLIAFFIYYYIKDHKENLLNFEKMLFEYLFLFVLFILTLLTARGAVRLIMVLVPIAPIFLSYLIVDLGYKMKTSLVENIRSWIRILTILIISGLVLSLIIYTQASTLILILLTLSIIVAEILRDFNKDREGIIKKLSIVFSILFLIVSLLSIFNGIGYYNGVKSESYSYIPNYYTIQWQEAMSWVRNNTLPNSVFAHWWDYGYWLQSIGNRATVTDGGNAIVWWNYLTGRLVLTGDNQEDSLNFLWNHNATHLLIDSSDIGKYGAFAQIGSNADYDRYSSGPTTMLLNEKQIQETSNGTFMVYQGTSCVEDDINYNQNNVKIFIPGVTKDKDGNPQCNAFFAGITLEISNKNNLQKFEQPNVVVYYKNTPYNFPLRYIYQSGKLYDFKTGLEATMDIIERAQVSEKGLQINKNGATIFISPRVMKGFLGQVYILNDPLNNFPNFKIVHSEQGYFTSYFNSLGANLGEFSYLDNYGGLSGPIKIWEIKYTGNEKINEDYLTKMPPSNITWKF